MPKYYRRGLSAGRLCWKSKQKETDSVKDKQKAGCIVIMTEAAGVENRVSPLTHVKDKKAEGTKDDWNNLLPVHREAVPLRLILKKKKKREMKKFLSENNWPAEKNSGRTIILNNTTVIGISMILTLTYISSL